MNIKKYKTDLYNLSEQSERPISAGTEPLQAWPENYGYSYDKLCPTNVFFFYYRRVGISNSIVKQYMQQDYPFSTKISTSISHV